MINSILEIKRRISNSWIHSLSIWPYIRLQLRNILGVLIWWLSHNFEKFRILKLSWCLSTLDSLRFKWLMRNSVGVCYLNPSIIIFHFYYLECLSIFIWALFQGFLTKMKIPLWFDFRSLSYSILRCWIKLLLHVIIFLHFIIFQIKLIIYQFSWVNFIINDRI